MGSWVLKRLADPRKRATVLEYFETVIPIMIVS